MSDTAITTTVSAVLEEIEDLAANQTACTKIAVGLAAAADILAGVLRHASGDKSGTVAAAANATAADLLPQPRSTKFDLDG